jgi:hypothetical protein
VPRLYPIYKVYIPILDLPNIAAPTNPALLLKKAFLISTNDEIVGNDLCFRV